MSAVGRPPARRGSRARWCGSSFKTAPAIGRVLAEWIVDGYPKLLDPRPFRLGRFADGQPLVGKFEYGDRQTDYTMARGVMLG